MRERERERDASFECYGDAATYSCGRDDDSLLWQTCGRGEGSLACNTVVSIARSTVVPLFLFPVSLLLIPSRPPLGRYAHLLVDLVLQLSVTGPSDLDRVDEARILSLSEAQEGAQEEEGRAPVSDHGEGKQGVVIGLSTLEVDERFISGLIGFEESTLRALEDECAVFMFFEQEYNTSQDSRDTCPCNTASVHACPCSGGATDITAVRADAQAAEGVRCAAAAGTSDGAGTAARAAATPTCCSRMRRLFLLGSQVRLHQSSGGMKGRGGAGWEAVTEHLASCT